MRPEKPPELLLPEPDGSALLEDEGGAADDSGAVDSGAAARQVVADLRSRRLELTHERVPAQRLAFGKDRLVQLTGDGVSIRDVRSWSVLARLPLVEPRRITSLSDGSVVAAGKTELLRVPADPMKAEHYSRLPLFMDSFLVGDRRDRRRLWVHHGIDDSLYPYQLTELGRLETLDLVPLEGHDHKGFAALKDGSFVYTAGDKLQRFFPGGKRTSFALPAGTEIWRVLTTHRIDRIWLVRVDGKLLLAQIGSDKLDVLQTLELAGAYDVCSNDTHLAVLTLEPGGDGGRSWKLRVLDAGGRPAAEIELPTDGAAASGDDWVREITKNRGVVLSPYAPLVAVGGPSWLAVWDYKKSIPVLEP